VRHMLERTATFMLLHCLCMLGCYALVACSNALVPEVGIQTSSNSLYIHPCRQSVCVVLAAGVTA
jgi:hypothetical protein